MELSTHDFNGRPFYYRPNTSDERAFKEVALGQIYRRKGDGFEPKPGEHWLDLGANVGSFAAWAASKGAYTHCCEPDPECYEVLLKNLAEQDTAWNVAVTAQEAPFIDFWRGRDPTDHYRATEFSSKHRPRHELGQLRNYNGREFVGQWWDGVKMDIEGSEGPLIDNWLLPCCGKLVMEYHTSRDPSSENLARRLKILKTNFREVRHHKEYDRFIAIGGNHKSFYDRIVYCWGWQGPEPEQPHA